MLPLILVVGGHWELVFAGMDGVGAVTIMEMYKLGDTVSLLGVYKLVAEWAKETVGEVIGGVVGAWRIGLEPPVTSTVGESFCRCAGLPCLRVSG